MCLSKCVIKDYCERDMSKFSIRISPDGKVLQYKSLSAFAWTSAYAGDAEWFINSVGKLVLKEHHNIEAYALEFLHKHAWYIGRRLVGALPAYQMVEYIIKKLDNKHIYKNLIRRRLERLEHHGFITYETVSDMGCFRFTVAGKAYYQQKLNAQNKAA